MLLIRPLSSDGRANMALCPSTKLALTPASSRIAASVSNTREVRDPSGTKWVMAKAKIPAIKAKALPR